MNLTFQIYACRIHVVLGRLSLGTIEDIHNRPITFIATQAWYMLADEDQMTAIERIDTEVALMNLTRKLLK